MKVEFAIPLVAPSLNQWYAGNHWSKRKKVADEWHKAVKYLCMQYQIESFTKPVIITTQTLLPTKRARDVSNCFAANKLAEDGLVKAGILKNDTPEYVVRHIVEKPVIGVGKGETLIIITEVGT